MSSLVEVPNPAGLVWDNWCWHAEHRPEAEAIVHWVAGEPPYRWTWGALLEAAARVARQLTEAGVGPGQVCALLVRHHKDFYPVYLGISAVGALPAVLAYPNARLHPDKFRDGLAGMARRSGLDWVLTERELEPIVRPLLETAGSTIQGLLFPLEWEPGAGAAAARPAKPRVAPTAPCLLQHSSGTTGLQKAVVLSHRAVLEHLQRYARALQVNPQDKIVSWLPLYHDMGLIAAFYLPLVLGLPLIQMDPFEWVLAPVILLEALAQERATLAWLPNFAYNLMAARIHDEDLQGVRLESLRVLSNCSEPIRAESHDAFYQRFAPLGLRREALAGCYAMAETTFAVTQTPLGSEAKRVAVNRSELARGVVRLAEPGDGVRTCVSSGTPIAGCAVRIVGPDREDLAAGYLGEIAIRSVSLFDGYRNAPEATGAVLQEGWYYSGDLGFLHEGELYVVGRQKDIIIVAGNNLYPEDIEDAVGRVAGVIPGRVVAFGLEDESLGTEQICVVAETDAADTPAQQRLRQAIVEAGMGMDVTVSRVYLAPPRWLIKSSAGKPSRRANKERAVHELAWS